LVGDDKVAQDVGNGGLGGGVKAIEKLNELARGVPSGAPWTGANAVELDRQSLGDWLAKQSLSDTDKISFNLSAILTYGAPPDKLGLLHYLSLINSSNCDLEKLESMQGGAQEKRFVGGSHILSVKMADALGDKVRLSSPVRKIVGWDRDVVELHTNQGITRARQVIAASSPSLCNQIIFDPPLPAERAQMQKLWPTNGRMRKTVHVYSRPFWRDADLNGQVIQIGGPILWSADNSPPDASVGIITAFVKEGSLPDDPKKAEGILSSIYARALGDEARQPTQYHEIDWSTVDSWSLSCTSPYPPGFLTKWGKFIHPPVGRLIWSGTDTADIWASSMDGAVRSGHRAALHAFHALARG
jgi:monoamine oxidase